MSIIRWRPQGTVRHPNPEFDHIVEDLLHAWGAPRGKNETGFLPVLNVRETASALLVEAELPGMESEDVEVSVHDGALFIQGEKRSEQTSGEEGSHHYRVERSYGSFQRRVPLPCPVDADAAEARLDKGVLHLTLPKRENGRATKIGVKAT